MLRTDLLKKWNSIFLIGIIILATAVIILTGIMVYQSKTHAPILLSYNDNKIKIINVNETNILNEFSDSNYKIFIDMYNAIRSNKQLYSTDGIIADEKTVIILADNAMNQICDQHKFIFQNFDLTRSIEHDEVNQLWVVKYKTADWPHLEAFIIIDQLNGAILYYHLPQPL